MQSGILSWTDIGQRALVRRGKEQMIQHLLGKKGQIIKKETVAEIF